MAPIIAEVKVTYYEDYVRKKAEQAFNQDDAKIALKDRDSNDIDGVLDPQLTDEVFKGSMREMTKYLFELQNEFGEGASESSLWDSENVDKIYITSMPLEVPTVIVQYKILPSWFEMKYADLREFYWRPRPSLSGELTAGYFQPR